MSTAEPVVVARDPQPRYQDLPALSAFDYAKLRDSIRDFGVFEPIVLDEAGHILDGHHRAKVCSELGIDCPTRVESGLSEDEKRSYSFWVNFARRHLDDSEKRRLIRLLEAKLIEDPLESDRLIARTLGVSHHTVAKRRRELEENGHVPISEAVRGAGNTHRRVVEPQPDEREPDVADDGEEEDGAGVAAAEHRRLCWFEFTYGYPGPVSMAAPRQRGPMPNRRGAPRLEWFSERVYLTLPAPTNEVELRAAWTEILKTAYRVAAERPPKTMVG